MLSAAVLLSFAWHCMYTFEVFDFTEHCSNPGLMHSNNAWDPVHAFCSSHALQGQLVTASLATPVTTMSFWTIHNIDSKSRLMHSNNAWDSVHAFCSSPAQLFLALQLYIRVFGLHTATQGLPCF